MLSRSSLTRRRYSSMLTWASHWKAVWGLGYKAGGGHGDGHPPLGVGGALLPRLVYLLGQLGDAQHILVGLGGQTQHEIELHAAPPAGEGGAAGAEDLLLRHILVDGVPAGAGCPPPGQRSAPTCAHAAPAPSGPGRSCPPAGRAGTGRPCWAHTTPAGRRTAPPMPGSRWWTGWRGFISW